MMVAFLPDGDATEDTEQLGAVALAEPAVESSRNDGFARPPAMDGASYSRRAGSRTTVT